MPRPIWKGSISFGLVNIPVTLYSAEQKTEIKFRMLDSRNNSRIRYERINEVTGEEVPWNAIIKGFEYGEDKYVLLSDEEMDRASAEATKTVDIEDFVNLGEVDTLYFDKPYYLEPGKGAEKSYALLVEAMEESGKAGIARVVIRSKQHLCALLARAGRLVMEMLRFGQEIRDINEIKAPDKSLKRNQVSKREKDMALELIDSMTVEWDPMRYRNQYQEKLMEWINERVESGNFEPSVEHEDPEPAPSSNVVDLVDYLKRSVAERGSGKSGAAKKASKKTSASMTSSAKKTTGKKAPAKKVTPVKKGRKAS